MGSGNCLYHSPEIFDLDEENLAIIVGDPAADADRVRQAVEQCPTQALSIASS
jgi:ferredoxin